MEIAYLILKITAASYLVLGVLFYFFLRMLLKNSQGFPVISPRSWHFVIAYPFRRKKNFGDEMDINFLRYFSKIFFMLVVGWPILVAWQITKMTLATPVLLMGGAYAIPSLEVMSEQENPFELIVKTFYLPQINGVTIYPAYIPGIALYGWLTYNWAMATLGATLSIAIAVGLVFLAVYVYDSIKSNKLPEWRASFTKRSRKITKYNYKIKVKSCTDR